MNKKIIFLISVFTLYINLNASRSFEESWALAQKSYVQLQDSLQAYAYAETQYTQPFWLESQKSLRAIILGRANQNVLRERIIQHTMVRMGFSATQAHEELYLSYCLSPYTKKLISQFKDIDFPFLPREINTFNCSSSTLGHLFYAAKTLEAWNHAQSIETIVEFGGGYGNLARIYKTLIPSTTIVILDLPETIALQKLYLDVTLPDVKTIIHNQPPTQLEPGAIHLIPIFFIDQLAIKADIFVSTFALSEAPKYTQQLVINQQFFHASVCYIAGQLNGWGGTFENHDLIMKGIHEHYKTVLCQPFHIQIDTLKNYELLAHA